MTISLCMRWLYVVMLSGLRVTTWLLEPRDFHLNVNIIEIGYRWRWQDVHGGPRRGEGVLGAGRGAIISWHDRISEFGHNNILWNGHHGNIFETVAMTTKYWLSRRFNWRLKTIMENSRRLGLYHGMLLWIAWDVYPFVVCTLWLCSSQLLG